MRVYRGWNSLERMRQTNRQILFIHEISVRVIALATIIKAWIDIQVG